MLGERSQSVKDKYHMLLMAIRNKTNKDEKRQTNKKSRLSNTENKLAVARREVGGRKIRL